MVKNERKLRILSENLCSKFSFNLQSEEKLTLEYKDDSSTKYV